MFDVNINLIRGHSYCGKTTFLIDLANNIVDAGFKVLANYNHSNKQSKIRCRTQFNLLANIFSPQRTD